MNMVPAFVDTIVCLVASCKLSYIIINTLSVCSMNINTTMKLSIIQPVFYNVWMINNYKWMGEGGLSTYIKIISTPFEEVRHDMHSPMKSE